MFPPKVVNTVAENDVEKKEKEKEGHKDNGETNE